VLQPGDRLGNYIIEGDLARGAIGVVFRARHARLGSLHAIKILRVDDDELRARLVEEGRAQASLHHPNVVRVTDLVDADGRPALVMDLVQGPTLAGLLRRVRPTHDESRRIFRAMAAGVAAAHRAGLVHRDLKPANVLLDRRHQPPRPRVADFGIARAMDRGPGATLPGRMIGTLGYLAPEQLGDARGVDARADVFSLGVMLVEMLTGARPWPEADPVAWLQAVSARPWTPPPSLPSDLARLAQDCLQADPQDRPAHAGELLEQLGPDLADPSADTSTPAPVRSVPPPAAQPVPPPPARPAGRRLTAAGWSLVGIALGALVASGVAPPSTSPLQPTSTPSSATLQLEAWSRADEHPAEALALLRAAASQSGEDLPDDVVLDLIARGAAVHVFPTPGPVATAALTPERVATATLDGRVRTWDPRTGELRADVPTGVHQPRDLHLIADSSAFILRPHPGLGREATDTLVWNLPSGTSRVRSRRWRLQPTLHLPDALLSLVEQPDGTPALTRWSLDGTREWTRPLPGEIQGEWGTGGGRVFLQIGLQALSFDVRTGEPGPRIELPERRVHVRASADGAHLTISHSKGVTLVDLATGERRPLEPDAPLGVVVHDSTGQQLAVVSPSWTHARLFDLPSARSHDLRGHARELVPPVFLDPQTIVTGSRDRTVRLFARTSGQPLGTLLGHHAQVTALATDGERIASTSLDRNLRLWTRPSTLLGTLEQQASPLAEPTRARVAGHSLVVSQAGHLRAWSPSPHRLTSWQVDPPGRPARARHRSDGGLVAKWEPGPTLLLHPDGTTTELSTVSGKAWMDVHDQAGVLAVATRRHFGLWSLADGSERVRGRVEGSDPRVAFSPDGSTVLVGHGAEGRIDVWRVQPPALLRTLDHGLRGQRGLASMAISPDGAWVVAGMYGGGAAAWRIDQGTLLSLGVASEDVIAVATDGRTVATAARSGQVALFDLDDGAVLARWQVPGAPSTLQITGTAVLLGDADGRLVHLEPGRDPVSRQAHTGPVRLLTLDGDTVQSVGADGIARTWSRAALASAPRSVASTGGLSNLRVCAGTLQVVPVLPFPEPESVWAPAAACASAEPDATPTPPPSPPQPGSTGTPGPEPAPPPP